MMILVRYLDGSYDMVMNHHLDTLISGNKIIGFERTNKWVTLGVDPVRKEGGSYSGPERRSPTREEMLDTY